MPGHSFFIEKDDPFNLNAFKGPVEPVAIITPTATPSPIPLIVTPVATPVPAPVQMPELILQEQLQADIGVVVLIDAVVDLVQEHPVGIMNPVEIVQETIRTFRPPPAPVHVERPPIPRIVAQPSPPEPKFELIPIVPEPAPPEVFEPIGGMVFEPAAPVQPAAPPPSMGERSNMADGMMPFFGIPHNTPMEPPPEIVAYTWNTGTAIFYRLINGKIAVRKKNGVWKMWYPPKMLVISRNPRLNQFNRAAAKLEKISKRLEKSFKSTKRTRSKST